MTAAQQAKHDLFNTDTFYGPLSISIDLAGQHLPITLF